MKHTLYNQLKAYCAANGNSDHPIYMTAKEWNECLGVNYSAQTFTALVNDGLLYRTKGYKAKQYDYYLPLSEEVLKKQAEAEKQRKTQNAQWRVEHYDDRIAEIKAQYEEQIKIANEWLERNLGWEQERLSEAQAFLQSLNN